MCLSHFSGIRIGVKIYNLRPTGARTTRPAGEPGIFTDVITIYAVPHQLVCSLARTSPLLTSNRDYGFNGN